MGIYSDVSRKTLDFGSIIAILSFVLSASPLFAGTLGTAESEQSRLQEEVNTARNALDALVLKPGMKLDDPQVREKSTALEEKLRAYHDGFQRAQTPPPRPTVYPNKTPDKPNGEREEKDDGSSVPSLPEYAPARSAAPPPPATEAPTEAATVLSGDGIQKEMIYSKKSKSGKEETPAPHLRPKVDHAEDPVPVSSVLPDAAGLSEIQYSKKKPPTK